MVDLGMFLSADAIEGALERAASAGDRHISGPGIGRPAVSSEGRAAEVAQAIKRFLEALPPEVTAADILEAMDGTSP